MVNWTDHALNQLKKIYDHIAQDSTHYAKRVSDALVHKTVGLDELPHIGRMVPEISKEHIREVSLYSYRIIYELKEAGQVDILAVIHKRQHLSAEDIPIEP